MTTTLFNPALQNRDDLIRGFVARHDLLESLLHNLATDPGDAPHNQLLIGQRGAGKTTMLHRLAIAIDDDPKLKRIWLPLIFPEEQYNVSNLGSFLLNVADAVSDALENRRDNPTAAKDLDERVRNLPMNERVGAALLLLREVAERLGFRLLLLVDNIDIVLDRLAASEDLELERILSKEQWITLVAASSQPLDALYDRSSVLFDIFKVCRLQGLSDEEMRRMVGRLAEEAGDERLKEIVRTQPARLSALRVLTGGNPRSVSLAYRILSEGPDGDIERDLKQFLDIYTPVYQDRLRDLAMQSQRIVDAMALHWDPIIAGDLVPLLPGMEVNQISAQLSRLEDFGLVEKVTWFGENKTAYQLAERSFNVWYLMRSSRRSRQRLVWLAKFLQEWFQDPKDYDAFARGFARRDPRAMGAERFAEQASMIEERVKSPVIRHELMHSSMKAIGEPAPFVALAWEEHRQFTKRLGNLEKQVLALRLKEVDSSELWGLLGGSPLFSVEEKEKAVCRLQGEGDAYASHLMTRLKAQRLRLEQASYQRGREVDVLYRELREGKYQGVYDPRLRDRLGADDAPRLPIVALHSRTLIWCMHKPMSTEELETAEKSWDELRALLVDEQNLSDRLDQTDFHRDCLSLVTAGKAWLLSERAERYEDAKNLLETELKVDPDSTHLLRALACLLRDCLGRPEDAERMLKRVRELEPDRVVSWDSYGRALAMLGRNDEAAKCFDEALRLDSEASYAWGSLANFLVEERQSFEGAEKAYRRALEINPESWQWWVGLGDLLQFNLSQFHEAEAVYEESLGWEPSSFAWNGLGLLWGTRMDKPIEAEEAFKKAIALDPTEGLFVNNLGNLYASQSGRWEEALVAYCKAAELDTQWKVSSWHAGWRWYNEGKLQEALGAFRQATNVAPEDSDGWRGIIQVLVDLHQYSEAEGVARQALALHPEVSNLWLALGMILSEKLDKHDEAETAYRRAIAIDQTLKAAWEGLIKLQTESLHQYAEAEITIREWMQIDGKSVEALRVLADLLANQLKRPEEAIKAYRKALELEPDNALTWGVLGDVLLINFRDYNEAEKAYLESIKLNAEDATTWTNYGILLDAQQNRVPEAIEKFEQAAKIDPKSENDPLGRLAILLLNQGRLDEALEAAFRAATVNPDGQSRKATLLQTIRLLADTERLQDASAALSRFLDLYPGDHDGQFVGAGLSVLLYNSQDALTTLQKLSALEDTDPDIWTFEQAVKSGLVKALLRMLEESNARDRWRPLYEALRAVQVGYKQYLRRIAPEIRESAVDILNRLAPNLPDGPEDQQMSRKLRKTKRWT